MRLSNTQVQDALKQMTAQVVPSNHPLVPQLEQIFGPHTFFVKSEGLHVVERGDSTAADSDAAYVVKVAEWANEEHTLLTPQQYKIEGTIDIGPEVADRSAPDAR